jgi:C_GCAxxG_C_C family probable redox protein
MNRTRAALNFFSNGYNCAQSTFAPFASSRNLDESAAMQIAACFGGGMGRTSRTCGAVTGALMALGMFRWKSPADKAVVYDLAAEYIARFTQQHGSTNCTQLLGCDLGTAEGRQAAQDKDAHNTICRGLVEDAVALLEEMIAG